MLAPVFSKVEQRLRAAGITHVGDAARTADAMAGGMAPINVQPEFLRCADGSVNIPNLAQLIRFFSCNPGAHA